LNIEYIIFKNTIDKMESLLSEAIKSSYNDKINTIGTKRVFKMGSRMNCNGEILKNTHIKEHMENVMKQYNIQHYQIETIDNQYEFGYELIVDEKNYRKIYQQISS